MPAFPDLTELSIEETAEVFETPLGQMEINESHSVHSCMSDDVQIDEEKQNICDEDEDEQWNHGYTARCIRTKDNSFAYAGQTERWNDKFM